MNRKAISLFSGAMGLDLGLMQAGIDIVIGQDFDLACIKTMEANGHKGIPGDIREIEPEDIEEARKKHPDAKNLGSTVFAEFVFPLIKYIRTFVGIQAIYIYALPEDKLIKHYKNY